MRQGKSLAPLARRLQRQRSGGGCVSRQHRSPLAANESEQRCTALPRRVAKLPRCPMRPRELPPGAYAAERAR